MKVFQALRVAYGDAEPADEKERARLARYIQTCSEQALTDGLLLLGATKGIVEFVPLPTVWEQEQARQAAREAALAAAEEQREQERQERLLAQQEEQEELARQQHAVYLESVKMLKEAEELKKIEEQYVDYRLWNCRCGVIFKPGSCSLPGHGFKLPT